MAKKPAPMPAKPAPKSAPAKPMTGSKKMGRKGC